MKKSGNASDTFAVLAILVNLQQAENSAVTKLFDSFTHVRAKNENYVIGKLFPLSHLLPRNTESFYRYNGSLSFPNCREVAIWTVFKDRLYISETQRQQVYAISSVTDNLRNAKLVANLEN